MIAALRAVRAHQPAKLIAAAAVAPPSTVQLMTAEADEVVCLEVPEVFHAVGQFYENFSQVSDAEVVALLRQTRPALVYCPNISSVGHQRSGVACGGRCWRHNRQCRDHPVQRESEGSRNHGGVAGRGLPVLMSGEEWNSVG